MQSGGPPITAVSSGPGPGSTASPVQAVANITSKPANNVIRGNQSTSYHVPRGAAAVANIAMPRSASLATPIIRSGAAVSGSLVTIRGTSRAPSPAPQQPRVRAAGTSSPAHIGSRPVTPQRVDTPRPALIQTTEKALAKNTVTLSQVSGQTAPFVSSAAARVATAPSTPNIQSIPSVPQTTMQVIAQGAQVSSVSLASQTTASVLSSASPATARPRPVSQSSQIGASPTPVPTAAPAVVLTAPARLASPGLLGVTTGPARLAVAAAVPASGARFVGPVGPTTRLPQGRTVTYTSSHQVLQTGRMPPTPVRLGPAGRGVLSLHPVLGVTPLKPAPAATSATTPASAPQSSASGVTQAAVQTVSQGTTTLVTSGAIPALQPAPGASPSPSSTPLRTITGQVQPAQAKVMTSAVVTVAAVGGGPLRSVVAAVAPGATPGATQTASLAPAPISPATVVTSAPASKTAYVQTSASVPARPVAVGSQPPRSGAAQPSVYIQTSHRSSPGPTTERPTTFPLQPATYFYEAPGAYQVARPFSGGTPYIVQAAAARPVGSSNIVASSSVPGTTATSSAASVVSSTGAAGTGAVVSTMAGSVVTSANSQSARFNSIMVVDPSRTALPIHAAYVPTEGGATGTTFIATDGSLVQALPVHSSSQTGPGPGPPHTSQSQACQAGPGQDGQPPQSTSASTASAHIPMQIQMVSTPVHIQMQPQGHAAANSVHVSSQQSSHLTSVSQASQQTPHITMHTPILPATQTATHTTQPQTSKPNASPRPSILRKRDNDGSPLKAQKNLTPLLQSMGPSHPPSNIVPNPAVSVPSSPPSPPKRPDSGGPQSSGSTTISATSSPGQESPPQGSGTQPPPSAASITAGLQAAGLHSNNEMSPRKKPRKQQLTGNELQEHKGSEDEMEFLSEMKDDDFQRRQQQLAPPPSAPFQQQQIPMQDQQQSGQQNSQQTLLLQQQQPAASKDFTLKRPNVSLLSTYRYSWKSRHNHFLRHSDVKPKDERRPTVSELASQKHIFQRLNGWKVHHLTTQMEDLAEVESQVFHQLETMLGVMERKAEQDEDKDVNRVSELIKGNMQRSRVIADQLVEAKSTVMKIFDHKSHVAEIITRSSGKRTFKKREKT